MPNLAGYDIIIEIARETLQDSINQQPYTLADSRTVHLFGGPFSFILPLNISGLVSGQLSGICEAKFEAVARTQNCRVQLHLTGVSLQVNLTGTPYQVNPSVLTNLQGTATLIIPMIVALSPEMPDTYFPGAALSTSLTLFIFDLASKNQISSQLNSNLVTPIEQAIGFALDYLLRSQGDQLSDSFSIQVIPGQASADPGQLSAPPEVMWIDAETLGVFGYYRQNAFGGNKGAKFDSDILQPGSETLLIEDNHSNIESIPAKRFAILISPEGFQRTIACPTLRNEFIRSRVANAEMPGYIEEARRQNAIQTNDFERLVFAREYTRLLGEGKTAQEAYDGGITRMNETEAAMAVNAFLDSPAGQQKIDAAFPPPCGNGVLLERIKMPNPFSDTTAVGYWLEMTLAEGHIRTLARARTQIENVLGDIDVEAIATAAIGLAVSSNGTINTNILNSDVSIDFDYGIVLTILKPFFDALFTPFALIFAKLKLEALAENTIFTQIGSNSINPSIPQGRLIDARVDPTGIILIGLRARDWKFNQFNPSVKIDATLVSVLPSTTQPVEEGVYTKHKSCLDEQPHDFVYKRHWFDTVWRLRLRATDVTLPITVESWSIELGYRSPKTMSTDFQTGLLGAEWSGQPVGLSAPSITLSGSVYYEAPPLEGTIVERSVGLGVQQELDFDMGWLLSMRAIDGNFVLKVQVSVIDGSGQHYAARVDLTINGEHIEFGSDYSAEIDACLADFQEKLAQLPPLEQPIEIPPWVPVWDPEISHAILTQVALRQQDHSGQRLLREGIEEFGIGFAERMQLLPPLTARSKFR